MSYLRSKSRQNVVNGTVAKSLPQNWVILSKSFVASKLNERAVTFTAVFTLENIEVLLAPFEHLVNDWHK